MRMPPSVLLPPRQCRPTKRSRRWWEDSLRSPGLYAPGEADADDGMITVGLDSMIDPPIIEYRACFIQKNIIRLFESVVVEGATGSSNFSEYDILTEAAIFCPTSPYSLLSGGRLLREYPQWPWKLARSPSHSLARRALDECGDVLIDAVTTAHSFLWKCRSSPSPRAAVQLPRGTDRQARSRAARARPTILPAAVLLMDGFASAGACVR
jgi:hypothetical protein